MASYEIHTILSYKVAGGIRHTDHTAATIAELLVEDMVFPLRSCLIEVEHFIRADGGSREVDGFTQSKHNGLSYGLVERHLLARPCW